MSSLLVDQAPVNHRCYQLSCTRTRQQKIPPEKVKSAKDWS